MIIKKTKRVTNEIMNGGEIEWVTILVILVMIEDA